MTTDPPTRRFASPIGIHDFGKLRRSGAVYVDKTAFVSELLRSPTEVTLLPRPRRFGKTLNLSTLRHFVDRGGPEDGGGLFEGLAVWEDADARQHFRRYPVIDLSFRGIKGDSWEASFTGVVDLLAGLCSRHASLLDDPGTSAPTRLIMERVLGLDVEPSACWSLLLRLSEALHAHHGEPVVILIDEYDAPIHAAYLNGYYDEAVEFFRNFLGNGLKDNTHLFKGVVTGILRVAKESIFSEFNNVAVFTMLDRTYGTALGFTETEVGRLAELAGAEGRMDALREWYDGYRFAGEIIYNPWSVLNFLNEPDLPPRAFWRQSGSDQILRELLCRRTLDMAGWQALLAGEAITRPIEESLTLRDLAGSDAALWSYLLFSGNLTATSADYSGREVVATLRIPNREVRMLYESVFAGWAERSLGSDVEMSTLLRALLRGEATVAQNYLTRVLTEQASYHDFSRFRTEAVYHAFILGLLVRLAGDFRVRSNAESGHGRADVLIAPLRAGDPGVLLELKVAAEGQTPEQALRVALAQIAERDYAAELRASGADPIHALAVVFDGRRAYVRVAG